ncbi:MAG: hypothetical protein C4563_10720 [Desulfobulbus sp.]|nr:MAG: hypothetical protein C4563_10720 [Desulfobulbus sp.]
MSPYFRVGVSDRREQQSGGKKMCRQPETTCKAEFPGKSPMISKAEEQKKSTLFVHFVICFLQQLRRHE